MISRGKFTALPSFFSLAICNDRSTSLSVIDSWVVKALHTSTTQYRVNYYRCALYATCRVPHGQFQILLKASEVQQSYHPWSLRRKAPSHQKGVFYVPKRLGWPLVIYAGTDFQIMHYTFAILKLLHRPLCYICSLFQRLLQKTLIMEL